MEIVPSGDGLSRGCRPTDLNVVVLQRRLVWCTVVIFFGVCVPVASYCSNIFGSCSGSFLKR